MPRPFSVNSTFESYFGQPKGQRILIVGCGLSAIAARMHALGYRCITAMDISPTAIALMQTGDQDKEGIECKRGAMFSEAPSPEHAGGCLTRIDRSSATGN